MAITSNNLGPDTIQLSDSSGNNLLNTLSTGADAEYKVNGIATDIQSTSSQVTLAPGLTVDLLAQSSSPVTITVTNSTSGLTNALSGFVSAYNTAVTGLQKNEGQNGGALQGDSLIYTLTNTLNQIAEFASGSGSVLSLADLGVTLQQNGQLSFDQGVALSSANASDVQQFLGSVGSSGFLQAANNELTSVTDPTNGLIAGDFNAVQAFKITNDNTQISNDQSNISQLQTNLTAQLSQADAAIATLRQVAGHLFQGTVPG